METVEASGFVEFCKLLRLAYRMGHRFYGGRKISAFRLYFFYQARGLCFGDLPRMKFTECKDEDTISFNEFLLSVHGEI